MQEPYIGEIMLFAGNFPPKGWAFCNGQILSIAQNSALFSILGTTYGGNGTTTFALPDLRSRVPVGIGQSPGLDNVELGEKNQLSTHGAYSRGYLGINYCIALYGLYPPRS
jgi:microcystin-dependent protein